MQQWSVHLPPQILQSEGRCIHNSCECSITNPTPLVILRARILLSSLATLHGTLSVLLQSPLVTTFGADLCLPLRFECPLIFVTLDTAPHLHTSHLEFLLVLLTDVLQGAQQPWLYPRISDSHIPLAFFTCSNRIRNSFHILDVVLGVESDSNTAFTTGTPCPADTVDVSGTGCWDIVVNDAIDAPEIDTTR